MPSKSKSRSKSQKKGSKKVIKKPAAKTKIKPQSKKIGQQLRKSNKMGKSGLSSKSRSAVVAKSQKRNKVAPVKKKIVKSKQKGRSKQQVKKQKKIKKEKNVSEIVSKSEQKESKKGKQKVQKKQISKENQKVQKKQISKENQKVQKKQISKENQKVQKKQISKEKKQQQFGSKQKSSEQSIGKSESKKKEKSYFDILYDYIKDYDKAHDFDPSLVQNEKKPYSLIEDIKIIYQVAKDDKHEGLGPVFWNELANKRIISRPVESMRDRYKRYIRFLDKNDFDRIISYLREQGTEGFMIFSKGEDGNRKLVNIQSQDPLIKIDLQEKHQEGVVKPNEQKSLEALQRMKGKKHQIVNKVEDKLFPIASDALSSNFKKIVVQASRPIIKSNESLLSSALLEELPMMKQVQNQAIKSLECIRQTEYKIFTNFQGNRYSSQQKITDVRDLNSVVNMLHFQFGKTRQEIIDDLQDVNGNIQSLIQIYQNPVENIHLKWTNEDDNILKQCKTKEDISFKLLVRYKGEESVSNRIKFKKFVLPFSI